MTTKLFSKVNLFWLAALAFALIVVEPAQAQRGGRGGFGGFDRSSPFRLLSQDDVEEELKLTDAQQDQIKKIQESLQPSEEDQQRNRERFTQAQTDEARTALFAELRKEQEAQGEAAMEKLKSVLQPNQYERLQQLRLGEAGVQGLTKASVAAELKLSDQQKSELEKLTADWQTARRELGFRASREEREKLEQEWNEKILAVLSPAQKTAWQGKLGKPLGEEDSAAPATANAATPPGSTPAAPRESYTPPVSDGPVVVSFDGRKAGSGSPTENAAQAEKGSPAGRNHAAVAQSSPAAAASENNMIQFHLENAPWEMVLNQFAKKAGLTPQILDIPPGSLTYTNDEKWYTPTQALDILHGYLLQKGHVMVKRDRFLVVLSIDKRPIPPNLIPSISIDELEKGDYGQHELLSVVIPLEGAEANDAAREVESLKGPQGSVVPLSVSNSLVVSDTYSNLRRIHGLLKGVTSKPDPEELQFKSFPLKHVAAAEAEVIVRSQLGLGSGVTNVSSTSNDWRSRFFSSRNDSRSRSARPTSTSSTPEAKVTADPRTNALLVTGTANQLAIAEQVLLTIDQELENPGQRPLGVPYLQVYRVQNADSGEVVKTIEALKPGLVVNDDRRADTIHIKATERQHEEIARLISQLDGGGTTMVAVIPLSELDPVAAAATLRSLFAGDEDFAPVIEADTYGRRLLVRGSSDQVAQVKLLLSQLGEDGTGTGPQNRDGSPFRVHPLGGRDAEEFARILERMWETSSTTPIRVVIPSNNPIRDRRIPSLRNEPDFLGPESRPSTRRGRQPEEPEVNTTLDRSERPRTRLTGPRPLFPVSMQVTSTGQSAVAPTETAPAYAEPAPAVQAEPKAEIEVKEESEADFGDESEIHGQFEEPSEAGAESEDQAEADTEPEMQTVSSTVTLRLSQTGEVTWDGESLSGLQLSKRIYEWLEATDPNERKFVISLHPDTPASKSTPVLGIVSRAGVQPSLKVSPENDSAAKPRPQAQAKPTEAKPAPETDSVKGNSQSAAPQAPKNAQAAKPPTSSETPITVTVRDGDLVLLGEGEQLDQMEDMIEKLALAIPPNQLDGILLRSADATETATMLEMLFPTSSVSASTYDDGSLFGGLSNSLASLGNSMADATGLNSLTQNPSVLRIIPEVRSNSLFVTGPSNQVRQVEEMLRVLDADDLPETLRDRVPRMIPVEYANINDVAAIVRDVYKDFLEGSNQRDNGGTNPLALMMGGGRSSGRNGDRNGGRQSAPPRMTIGVDAQTSKLVVSASDALFRQVQDMVAELDQAARDARKSVQVVSVDEANSVVIQQALSALLPTISVSHADSGSNGRSRSTSQSSGDSSAAEARRAAFFERMRSMQSGDSSRSTGGSSRFSGRGGSDRGRGSFGGSDRGRGSFGGSDRGRSGFGDFGGRSGSDRGDRGRGGRGR